MNLDAAGDHPERSHRRVGLIVGIHIAGAPQHGGNLREDENLSPGCTVTGRAKILAEVEKICPLIFLLMMWSY